MVHRDMILTIIPIVSWYIEIETNNNTNYIMVHRDMILAIIPIVSWYIEI